MVSYVGSSGLSSGQSVAFRGMSSLPLACVPSMWTVLPAHLPRSSSCSALSPCVRSPTQVCVRRAAVSVLAAMWCGSISDHSSFSVSPYFPVSDSRWRPGTACVTSSWVILISPAKLCAQEESQSLACMWGAVVPGCMRGRWAPWESDRADQESNSPSLLRLALLQTSEQMRTGHQGVQAPQSRSGYKSFESSESVSTHSVPCSVQAALWHQGEVANPTSPYLHLVRRESPAWVRRAEHMEWGWEGQEKGCGEGVPAGGQGLGEGNMREGL